MASPSPSPSHSHSHSSPSPGPTYGDIHFTPYYDTTYQHFHGYNERNRDAKAAHWAREYQWHSPSAQKLRERFVTKPGRDEQRRTLPQNAEVSQLLQSRTQLLGGSKDLSTRNSLRVAARYGESSRGMSLSSSASSLVNTHSNHPGGFVALHPRPMSSQQQAAHDAWMGATAPLDRSTAYRPPTALDRRAQLHWAHRGPISSTMLQEAKEDPYNNPRLVRYESEYNKQFGATGKEVRDSVTAKPDFFARSTREFEAQEERATLSGGPEEFRRTNPLSAQLSPVERVRNERVDFPALESMRRPVQRKTYPALDDRLPAARRSGEAYSFDVWEHVRGMRPNMKNREVAAMVPGHAVPRESEAILKHRTDQLLKA